MEGVASIAALAAFAGMWWWFNRVAKGRGWKWFVRHPLGALSGSVALAFVAAILMPVNIDLPAADSPSAATAASEAAPVESAPLAQPPAPTAATLGISAEEYLERFNERLGVTDVGLRGELLRRTEGQVNDSRIIRINQLHSVVLTLDKPSGQVSSVMYIGQGDGTFESGAHVMVVAVAAMISAARDESPKAISAAVLDLVAQREGEEWSRREVGQIELGHQSNDVMGTVFSAAPQAPLG